MASFFAQGIEKTAQSGRSQVGQGDWRLVPMVSGGTKYPFYLINIWIQSPYNLRV